MGFNRISVVENGIKQEGQQWGADHGLELDAFNAGQVSIRKGPYCMAVMQWEGLLNLFHYHCLRVTGYSVKRACWGNPSTVHWEVH